MPSCLPHHSLTDCSLPVAPVLVRMAVRASRRSSSKAALKAVARTQPVALSQLAPLVQVRATGGGAHRFAERFRERLGVILKKEDEMSCLVEGCNFLLRAVQHQAFHYRGGECSFLSQAEGPHSLPTPMAASLRMFP
jgi:Fumble